MSPRERAHEILKESPELTPSQLIRVHREKYGKGLDFKVAKEAVEGLSAASNGEADPDITFADVDAAASLVKEMGGVDRASEILGKLEELGAERFRACLNRLNSLREALT